MTHLAFILLSFFSYLHNPQLTPPLSLVLGIVFFSSSSYSCKFILGILSSARFSGCIYTSDILKFFLFVQLAWMFLFSNFFRGGGVNVFLYRLGLFIPVISIGVRDQFYFLGGGELRSLARIFYPVLARKSSGFAGILHVFLPESCHFENSRGLHPPSPPPPSLICLWWYLFHVFFWNRTCTVEIKLKCLLKISFCQKGSHTLVV